jgi:NAD(P)H-dependent FMN reductase
MAESVRVVAIPGSLREGSYTRLAAGIALRGAKQVGAETELLDLRALDLPFCDGRDDESTYPAGVHALRAKVRGAQGVILATPEYHGGVSGVLKNALDLMGFEEFEGKMMGLVGVSGGALGAASALAVLRTTGRVLHAWVVPEQAGIAHVARAFDARGELVDARLEERVLQVGRQVARFAYLHSSAQAREFLRAWESATPNPGGQPEARESLPRTEAAAG